MRISVCITVLNEEGAISKLVDSLLSQSKKPDEIIVVDGGSTDETREILKHYQKKDKRIKLLFQRCSRSKGRNVGVEIAKNEIIAMTDAGCIAERDWIKNITDPFKNAEIDISAGFYDMLYQNSFEKAENVFLGVRPDNFDIKFLPSTRSIAFRKEAWERIGGFDEGLEDTAEDTVFNYKALKLGMEIARVKNARVGWRMPESLEEFSRKTFKYARGDALSGIWFYPSKTHTSHNIKILGVFARYILGLFLVFYSPILLLIVLPLYAIFAFRKSGVWGIPLQIVSDFSVMSGFIAGTMKKK